MNCTQAREILNVLLDGEQHPRADEAQQHLTRCAACAEWHSGMERSLALLQSIRDEIPEADISAAVTASLPARHPASVRRPQTHAVGRMLAWVGASWAAGAAMLVALLAIGVSIGTSHAQGASSFVDSALTMFTAMSGATARVLADLGDISVVLLALFVPFAVLGAVMLAAVLVIWRSRRRITGTHIVLC